MKLDNKGWGLRDMLVYTGIILFFLIVVSIYISTLYNDISADVNDDGSNNDSSVIIEKPKEEIHEDPVEEAIDYTYYHVKEYEFEKAVHTYLVDNNYTLTTDIYNISLNDLVAFGYISPIYDNVTGEKCTGYANVLSEGTSYDVREYIMCYSYTTEGY